MVAQKNKLKGKMTENRYSLKSLSKELGMCESSLFRKINSENAEFTVSESWMIKKLLNLTIEEYLSIFHDEECI